MGRSSLLRPPGHNARKPCTAKHLTTWWWAGGSAGCAIASRLSEDGRASVCLLEAGGSDNSVFVQAPAAVVGMLPIPFKNWAFRPCRRRA